MRKIVTPLVGLLCVVLALITGCGSEPPSATGTADADGQRREITVVDDQNRSVTVTVPVRRVIAFNTFNVEYIRAVGAFDAVVGIDGGTAGPGYAGYFPGFDTSLLAGAGQAQPDYERIVALRPEVVIFPRNGAWQDAETKLAPFGIKVVVVTGWDQAKATENVSLIGKLFDKTAAADKLTAFYNTHRQLLVDRLRGVPTKPVYVENDKDFASPIPGSGWHDMIGLGGGNNIFGDVRFDNQTAKGSVHQFEIEPEAVLARQPELIIRLTGGGYALNSATDPTALGSALLRRPGWDQLPAVRDHAVWVTSSFPMNACAKVIGSLYVAKWLHPETFADVDPDAVMKQWITEFQSVPLDNPNAYYREVA